MVPSITVALFAVMVSASPAEQRPAHVTKHFRFFAAEPNEAALGKLTAGAEPRFERLCRMIDACDALDGPMDVWVARDAEAFAAAFPDESPVSEWAVGVAFPRSKRIVLRAHGTAIFSLVETFDHEISHVLVRALAADRHLPRWFVEGVAIWQAGEGVLSRLESAQKAALTDNLIPIDDLDRRFPDRRPRVDLAYAESALFVRWLGVRHGPFSIRKLLRRVKNGDDFYQAFERVYGKTPTVLAKAWSDQLEASSSPLLLLRDGTIIWIGMAALFVWVSIRKRRQRRAAIAAMGEVEDIEDAWTELEIEKQRDEEPTLH